jgi:hypothetical protein
MSEDRKQILDMLAAGQISVEEADRLISALGSGPEPSANGGVRRAKYLRVEVDAVDPAEGPTKVNIRVPMMLLRAGVKLSALIPPAARTEVNAAMARKGLNFDLSQLKPENLEELISELDDLTVNVDNERAKVRVYCE